jgi:hypothetical protein
MKKPLDAARDLVSCFRWDLNGAIHGNFDETKVMPGRTIPHETWAPVVIALRKFLNGDSKTLDDAFGGSTASNRNHFNRRKQYEHFVWLVNELADDYRKLPKEEKLSGVSPKQHGINRTAELFDMTASAVEDIYNGYR